MATLIMTAKLNDIDPQAWLADVPARIAGIPQGRLAELLPLGVEMRCASCRSGGLITVTPDQSDYVEG
jgi:transposase